MIKSLQLHISFKKTAAIFLCNGIHTNRTFLARFRRKIPRALPDKPGVRIRKDIVKVNSDYPDEIIDEYELDHDLNTVRLDEAYAEHISEKKRFEERVKLKIAANKFFSPEPQPSTLTSTERTYMQYLHKQDPVKWNVKVLSETFPATPEAIKKVLKSKVKITPERAKIIDSKVQKNWELLSEGKLDAEPQVLEHLKKFVNRREVLLDQIIKENSYLPVIKKKEHVWNQGEMNNIIALYEKDLKRLAQVNNPEALTDGLSEVEDKKEKEKSNSDFVQPHIKVECEKIPESKDSFRFGEMINTYRKHRTSEGLESKILEEAERGTKLSLKEKVNLDNKSGVNKENNENLINSSNPPELEKRTEGFKTEKNIQRYYETIDLENNGIRSASTTMEEERFSSFKAEKKVQKKFYESSKLNKSMRFRTAETKDISYTLDYISPDENTCFSSETGVGKILSKLQNKPHLENEPTETIETVEKKEINFSVEERKQENAYYDNEVLHIKNTAFWNNQRNSREKAMAELEKRDLDGPMIDKNEKKIPKIFVLNPDPYPERIKIPVNKRGSGLTFRIKDCYYDDDGEFLYRVPGMTK